MSNRPLTVNISLGFIVLDALIWLTLCILIAFNAHPGLPDLPFTRLVFASTSFAIAAVLFGLAFFILRHSARAYYLVLAIFIITILLTIFDNVGLSDLVVLILNIIPVILMIKDRKWYLQNISPADTSVKDTQ